MSEPMLSEPMLSELMLSDSMLSYPIKCKLVSYVTNDTTVTLLVAQPNMRFQPRLTRNSVTEIIRVFSMIRNNRVKRFS